MILRLLKTLSNISGDVAEISDWVDKSIEGHPLAFQLFGFAKECTHANFRKRTKIQFVFEALEKIQKGEREALVLQKMRDDQNEQLEHQKAVKMMRQMAIVGNKSTVPIGDCGIPDLPLEPPKILLGNLSMKTVISGSNWIFHFAETQDDDVEAEDVAMVEDSDSVAGIPDQQADQFQINQPAILNNAVEAKKSDEASVQLIYDDTTQDNVGAEKVVLVQDRAGIPDQQAQYQINQPAVLNNAVEAKKSEEASVDLIYDDTTEDFTRDRTEDFTQDWSFNESSSKLHTGDVE